MVNFINPYLTEPQLREVSRSVMLVSAKADAKWRTGRFFCQKEGFQWAKENLLQSFRDEETFGFLTGDERWEELCRKE